MHLAALVPQTPHASTYFVGVVAVVGGGPPKEKDANARTKTVRSKATSNMSLDTRGLTVGYSSHSSDE